MHSLQHTQPQKHASLKGLTVVLLFVVAQILGIFHLVEHSIEGDNDGCEICMSVAHADVFAMPELVQLALPAETAPMVTDIVLAHFYLSSPLVYSSRAPPFAA